MSEEIEVQCPACKKLTIYSPANVFRPFCSERCKLIDLGRWASEDFRIATEDSETDPKDGSDDPSRDE